MSEWIPVKKTKHPKKTKTACLVTIILDGEPFVRIAYYVGKIVNGGWLFSENNTPERGYHGENVTAWMLYPEPYEENKQ